MITHASSDPHEHAIFITGLMVVVERSLMQAKSVWLEELFVINSIKAQMCTLGNLLRLTRANSV